MLPLPTCQPFPAPTQLTFDIPVPLKALARIGKHLSVSMFLDCYGKRIFCVDLSVTLSHSYFQRYPLREAFQTSQKRDYVFMSIHLAVGLLLGGYGLSK